MAEPPDCSSKSIKKKTVRKLAKFARDLRTKPSYEGARSLLND